MKIGDPAVAVSTATTATAESGMAAVQSTADQVVPMPRPVPRTASWAAGTSYRSRM